MRLLNNTEIPTVPVRIEQLTLTISGGRAMWDVLSIIEITGLSFRQIRRWQRFYSCVLIKLFD